MNTSFIKCEGKFIIYLLIGLILLNALGFIFQYLFNSALLISIAMSIIALMVYFIYFLFGIVKFILLKKEFKCIDINKRVASWLSSLV